MPLARPRALRRRLAVLVLGVVTIIAAEVSLPVSSLAPVTATAVADSGRAYDRSLRVGECALLGRAYATGLGCARDRCVDGAVLWRKVAGAEACALVGQPKGFGYAATVGVRQCQDLHRRWIAAVNYCASLPDRSLTAVRDAPQCVSPASTYVTLSEKEGRYDECLTMARTAALSRQAAVHGTTLAAEVAARQRRAESSSGGVLMVGDSVTWRGNDELARLWPALTVDAEPARRPTELAARLDAVRAKHGPPAGLVVELGTNPAAGFRRRDLAAAVRSLPTGTPVMLVLPYVEVSSDPVVVSSWSQRFVGWMRSVAGGRPHTCVADWPAHVRSHRGLLQDGIHPRNDAEAVWAGWVLAQWSRCFPSSDPKWLSVNVYREPFGVTRRDRGRVSGRTSPRRSRSRGTSPRPSACGARGRSARSGAARTSAGTP